MEFIFLMDIFQLKEIKPFLQDEIHLQNNIGPTQISS
jgi:hypothetical protein